MFLKLMLNRIIQNNDMARKLNGRDITLLELIDPLRISAPYVIGSVKERGCKNTGSDCIGMNSPHKNIMGNRKKFENVWASKTSLTETAMKSPRNVETIAIKTMAGIARHHDIPDKSTKNNAIIIGTNALRIPKKIAPPVLASIRRLSGIGANNKRSKERFFFSNVTVTASMEVVPKRMEMHTTPGRSVSMSSRPCPDFMNNIAVHANGNIRPQLIFGGLR
jgi:hypothetical protein